MRKKTLNFFMLRSLIKKITDSYTRIRDRAEERPQTSTPLFLFLITFIAFITIVFWIELWLPYVVIENARWVLSAQVQATAAILGLLVVAMAFKWRMVTNQEQQLRSNIYSYLKMLGTAKSGTILPSSFVIDLTYEKYLAWINATTAKRREIDIFFMNLGKLWVIRELSFIYSSGGAKEFNRHLKHGQTKQLSKTSERSKKSAIEMWEHYYRNPAQFILEMYRVLRHVYATLFDLETTDNNKGKVKQSYGTFDAIISIVSQILADGSKLIAEETKRVRSISQPFVVTSVVLISAIVIGLLALTGISNTNLLLNLNSDVIRWVVGIPIGLSVYGIFLCLLFIRAILS